MKVSLNQTGVGVQGKKLLILRGALKGDMTEEPFNLGFYLASEIVPVSGKMLWRIKTLSR